MREPLIIGGGPAGAAAAIRIASAGRAVTLIEHNVGPTDKVCGDFLSSEVATSLGALGVDLTALSPELIGALRLLHGERCATTALPFTAFGIKRRVLDEALLRRAMEAGAAVQRGHAVRRIHRVQAGYVVDVGCDQFAADSVFLATGKHELRGMARPFRESRLLGLKMYYALEQGQQTALRGQVELVLFEHGYAGLQPVAADEAVLCVLVSHAGYQAVGGSWKALVESITRGCPHLGARLGGALPLLERPLAIAGLPYGYLTEGSEWPDLFRLGDQAMVVGSLTGDGVAQALASGSIAAGVWLRGAPAGEYYRKINELASWQMRIASALHRACLNGGLQSGIVRLCGAWPAGMRLAAVASRARKLTHAGYAG
jgi:menaquinone-9 beta-reductase